MELFTLDISIRGQPAKTHLNPHLLESASIVNIDFAAAEAVGRTALHQPNRGP